MTKEKFIELVKELTEEEVKALINGINQITFEYGWDKDLDNTNLIKECYYE